MQALNNIKDFDTADLPSEIGECAARIKGIFDEIDIVTANWVLERKLHDLREEAGTLTLLVGDSRTGKSSLLSFLIKGATRIGDKLDFGSILPSKVYVHPPSGIEKKPVPVLEVPAVTHLSQGTPRVCVSYIIGKVFSGSPVKVWYLLSSYLFLGRLQDYVDFLIRLGNLLQWNPDNIRCLIFVFSCTA